MKKIKLLALSAVLLGAGWSASLAPAYANHKEMTVEEHVKKLKDKLDLTTEQEAQVRTVIQDKKNRIDEAMRDSQDKIRAILSADQQEKFNKIVLEKEKDKRD